MRLHFHSTFLSIKDFPEIDLPNFTLITGLNGTGKSHILKAIQIGRIRNDITQDFHDEIRLYDWNNLATNEPGVYDGRQWLQERLNIRDSIRNSVRQSGNEILDTARAAGVPTNHLVDATQISLLSPNELKKILGNEEHAQAAHNAIQNAARNVSSKIRGQFSGNDNFRKFFEYQERISGRLLTTLGDKDFYADNEDRWGRTDMFKNSLSQAFVAYRDLALKNELKLRAKERGRDTDALTEDEFIQKHMIAPWSFVNESIKTANLDFEIDHPDLDDYVPYQPKLTKRSTGAEVLFSELSSGERILMSLALCLYYTEDRRQIAKCPKILLLDEVDATLHPSMTKFYLDVLIKTVVEKNNITVIATTHSPSTVALAPEESLYVVEQGKPGLHKTTKSRALNILTDGVPTLAISYEGRRQVFVESPNDAKLYDIINQHLKPYIKSERSLEFVATGLKNPRTGEHKNTGCDIVSHLVETLQERGNNSVFGLIDWDSKNDPTQRIMVLAHGKRNGIENVILDPLLVASFVARNDRGSHQAIGIDQSYPDFLSLPKQKLQPIVDLVQEKIIQHLPGTTSPSFKVSSCYLGGFELNVWKDLFEIDDHKLENAVLAAFPRMKAFANRSGALMLEIASTVMKDQPAFIPVEFRDALAAILTSDSH